MRNLVVGILVVACLLFAPAPARAEPARGDRAALLRPMRALAGALKLGGLYVSRRIELGRLGRAHQLNPKEVVYEARPGSHVFDVANELHARANLTGKRAIAHVNERRIVVAPGERLSRVNARVALHYYASHE